ncbi:MAG: hypothetical protein KatS3mg104_0871 [Phycisphaerae bacterium]|jgi:hypothetical protein|nr:MAG: hypothetical protein KatS3mg104_0871 [Phycisphaerae bacterium]
MIFWRFQIRLNWSGFSIQFRTGRKKSKKPVVTASAPVPITSTPPLPTITPPPVWTATELKPFSRTFSKSPVVTKPSRLPVRYTGYIAGFRFHDGPLIINKLRRGMNLRVVRQPHNLHDSNAIQLFMGPYLLGYIPRGPNRKLARRLDAAEVLICRINRVDPNDVPWHQVEISIESLSISKSHCSENNLDEISSRSVKSSRLDESLWFETSTKKKSLDRTL